MDFLDGGDNIAITTALPPSFFCIVLFSHSRGFRFQLSIIHSCLGLRFPDMKTNPGARRPVPDVSRILCSDVREPVREPQWSRYNILLWFETFGSVLVPAYIWWPSLLLCLAIPRALGMVAYVRDE